MNEKALEASKALIGAQEHQETVIRELLTEADFWENHVNKLRADASTMRALLNADKYEPKH